MSENVTEKLVECLRKAEVNLEGYTNIDRLLYRPNLLKKIANLIADYLKEEDKDKFSAIVVPDKLKGPFGILPIGILVAIKLNKRLIIWKEFAIGFERLFGVEAEIEDKSPPSEKGVLILHDVVVKGNTIVKITEELRRFGFPLYKALVLISKNQDRIEQFEKLEKKGKITILIPSRRRKKGEHKN